ncbi:MAG TPA: roadblock/LC7 domain-containing protein [Gemmatimonadales bacterium]|jgi:predicted regulator of Ras-like GTPase activity (Roadblock/LC7/MglB family)
MAGLRDVVRTLAARSDVDAVIVLSSDGLPIDSAGRARVDAEAVAALAATFASGARRLGQAAECTRFTGTVLEFDDRLAVVRSLGTEGHLFILAARATNLGPLLFELRRQAPQLATIL